MTFSFVGVLERENPASMCMKGESMKGNFSTFFFTIFLFFSQMFFTVFCFVEQFSSRLQRLLLTFILPVFTMKNIHLNHAFYIVHCVLSILSCSLPSICILVFCAFDKLPSLCICRAAWLLLCDCNSKY